ncbi:putative uncharacterized protein [Burkholderiales bacterium GJ-E10]|nr:putative uncharacterized protein [Burkholderiales bacterium GJ-E10]
MVSWSAKQCAEPVPMHSRVPQATRPDPRRTARLVPERPALERPAHPVLRCDAGSEPWRGPASHLSSELRRRIDDLMLPLQSMAPDLLDRELGERLDRIVPMRQCLCVLVDHGCTGLDPLPPRMHGTMAPELQRLYATMIAERDPLLLRASQEWRPLIGTIEEHCSWIHTKIRHPDVIKTWLRRNAANSAADDTTSLAVVPARGGLSRGALFAFFSAPPSDSGVFALFYAAQRIAIAMELRVRPYIHELLAMRFTPREADVLRAGLLGEPDDEIADRLGLTVDAIRYYFRKFKNQIPGAIGGIKPREFARVMHNLGKL